MMNSFIGFCRITDYIPIVFVNLSFSTAPQQVKLFQRLQPGYRYNVTVFIASNGRPWQYVNFYSNVNSTTYIRETFNATSQFAYRLLGKSDTGSLPNQQVVFQNYNTAIGKNSKRHPKIFAICKKYQFFHSYFSK